jgi:hypothetical protein
MTLAKTVGVTVLLGVVLFALHAVAGPFFSLGAQRWGPEPRGDKLIGVVEGHLKGADVATHTLRIASGFLGLDSVSLEVTVDTQIGVHGKLGGFGDLDRGKLVRAVYEVTADRLVASRVDVLASGSTTELAVIPARLGDDTPADRPAPRPVIVNPVANEPAVVNESAVAAPPPVPDSLAASDRAAPELPERAERPTTSADVGPPPRVGEVAKPTPSPRVGEVAKPTPSPRVAEVVKPTPRALPVSPRRPRARTEPAASPAAPRLDVPPSGAVSSESRPPAAAKPVPPRRDPEDAGAVIDWLLNTSPARRQ